tara:strand:+ start:4948 stop:6573 length:1626 start_codon:yes stop_codon:yes gene_type:complete
MPITLEVGYFNSFYMKRLADLPTGNGETGATNYTTPTTSVIQEDWYVEESRIRGGYNNTSTDLGVKAYIVEDNDAQQRRKNSLIYSGIFNSRTGVNQSNQFSTAEEITRSVDPSGGSIQKLYAEDTNLIIFQEDKVNRALIDKDAIYSAEGSAITTTANLVIGQIVSYAGEYGISTNPESFAVYGYQKYFTDRNRNAVLRLSRDGITEISNYGMVDFFRDKLSLVGSTGKIIGSYDIYNKNYVVSLQENNGDYNTLGFEESTNGWISFYDYKPSSGFSSQGKFFTTNGTSVWKHYSTSVDRGSFYGASNKSSVKLVLNPDPTRVKTFKTIDYEGTNGWEVISLVSDDTGTDLVNGVWVNNSEQGTSSADPATFTLTNPGSGFYVTGNNVGTSSDGFGVGMKVNIVVGGGGSVSITSIVDPGFGYQPGDVQTVLANGSGGVGVNATFVLNTYTNVYSRIYSYDEGIYFENNVPYRAGFDRKQNRYVAAIRNNSTTPLAGQVLSGPSNTGIKAYYTTVTMQTDTTTDPGGLKELFAVSSTYGR